MKKMFQAIIQSLREETQRFYGERLVSFVLFGSVTTHSFEVFS